MKQQEEHRQQHPTVTGNRFDDSDITSFVVTPDINVYLPCPVSINDFNVWCIGNDLNVWRIGNDLNAWRTGNDLYVWRIGNDLYVWRIRNDLLTYSSATRPTSTTLQTQATASTLPTSATAPIDVMHSPLKIPDIPLPTPFSTDSTLRVYEEWKTSWEDYIMAGLHMHPQRVQLAYLRHCLDSEMKETL